MENIEEGKISEVPKDTAVVVEQPKETREPRARNTFATFLATIAVLLGAGGLTFGVLAYNEAHKPLTVLSSGTDGN